jgi:ribosomal protein S18 acetylase RimI-like enzyme
MELSDVAALPATPIMPDGLAVRPVGPEHYRALWDAANDAYRGRDVIMVLPTEEDYQEEYVHNPYLDPSLIQAAWAGDDIAGLVRCETLPGPGPHGYGVVAQVAVRPAWRRRGLAYGLLLRGLHALRARGIQMVRLDVRQDNATHAQDLYERAGFHVLKEHVRYRKPMR